MISLPVVLWALAFLVCVIAARIILNRFSSSALRPRVGLRIFMIAIVLAPAAIMVRLMLAGGLRGVTHPAMAVGVAVIVMAVVIAVGIVMAPFIAEIAATFGSWLAIGAPSEASLKEIKSFDRARALTKRDKLREAVAEYRIELAKDPTQWHGYKELADVLEKLGDVEQAAAELLGALPHVDDVEQQALIQLRVVDLQCRVGKIESARTLLAHMEQQSWPDRIARAIQTRRQRL